MAIARDAVTNVTNGVLTVLTLSFSHTVTGDKPILIVTPIGGGLTSTFSSVKYNGISLTFGTGYQGAMMYYLVNAPTGTHTVDILYDPGAAATEAAVATSYTGVAGIGASGFTTYGGSPTSVSQTLTTTAPNSWVVGFGAASAQVGTGAHAGTNYFGSASITPTGDVLVGDSGVVSTLSSVTIQTDFTFAPLNGIAGALELVPATSSQMMIL